MQCVSGNSWKMGTGWLGRVPVNHAAMMGQWQQVWDWRRSSADEGRLVASASWAITCFPRAAGCWLLVRLGPAVLVAPLRLGPVVGCGVFFLCSSFFSCCVVDPVLAGTGLPVGQG